jgi:HipA-like protein
MKRANVYCLGRFAGTLSKTPAGGYRFEYAPDYRDDPGCPAISLTLPKRAEPYESNILFPFFFGLMAEGDEKTLQCRVFRIDECDHFRRLVKTCSTETIGGVTVRGEEGP